MAKLTIAAAARLCHVDRRTLQRAIHAGRLHLDAQHCLSTDELMRAGYLIADTPHGTPLVTPLVEPQGTPLLPLLERLTVAVEGLWQEARQLREVLLQTPQGTPQPTPQDTPLVTPQRWRHKTTKTPQVTP